MNDRPPAGIGHNRPPAQSRLAKLPLDAEAVQRLIEELHRLRAAAITECQGHIRDYVQVSPWRFSPSRLERWPTGRQTLATILDLTWPQAIAKRLPQIARVERKLARLCADWPGLSEAQLTEAPCGEFFSTAVGDTWSVRSLLTGKEAPLCRRPK
jgi:hypothetical protein